MGPITRFLVTLANGQTMWVEKQNVEDQHPYQVGDSAVLHWEQESGALLRPEVRA